MLVLQATGDIRKVSLWLGHVNIRTTEIYLRADPTEKLDAIESAVPLALRRGQFRAPDKLIASLLGDGLAFHLQVDGGIAVGGVDAGMAEPLTDGHQINA